MLDLGLHRQRYALLLAENGGILDDLMVINRGEDYLLIVNASRKHEDLAWIQARIGSECTVTALPDMALVALQGPLAGAVLQRPVPATSLLNFMQGTPFDFKDARGYITRSGYTGEDGFEISLPATHIEAFARWVLKQPHVLPAGLGARNTLRLEAGLCLLTAPTWTAPPPPSQAGLNWSIPKVRRSGGQRAGGFTGADVVLAQIEGHARRQRARRLAGFGARACARRHACCTFPAGMPWGWSPADPWRPAWIARLPWATSRPIRSPLHTH